ncbi:MAG: hypothetical protein DMD96_08675 [Candidatus Rokuibacteriota bacterium]|nr:MAG: hypothetical protein DMD96_08675 [Candidatus Rokubacteria bacterium]
MTPAGLCATCRHANQVTSAKRSTFVRCGLSVTDPRFPKYPRLPVSRCEGFEPPTGAAAPQGHQT